MDEFKVGDRVMIPAKVTGLAKIGHPNELWFRVDVTDGEGSAYRNLRFPPKLMKLMPPELPRLVGSLIEVLQDDGESLELTLVIRPNVGPCWSPTMETSTHTESYTSDWVKKQADFTVIYDRGAEIDE